MSHATWQTAGSIPLP